MSSSDERREYRMRDEVRGEIAVCWADLLGCHGHCSGGRLPLARLLFWGAVCCVEVSGERCDVM